MLSCLYFAGHRTIAAPQRASAEDTRSSAGLQSLLLDPPSHNNNNSKKTTFAALPQTTTTWQQQQANTQALENPSSDTGMRSFKI